MQQNGNYPPQPFYHHNAYPDPAYTTPDPNYSGIYGSVATEREKLLERQLAQAEVKALVLEQKYRSAQQELMESERKLTRWRLNLRASTIAFLSIFIVVWATVSLLVQYPVLPWNMPTAIGHLLSK